MSDADLRDRFLHALDARDTGSARHLASFLGDSTRPLPSPVCTQLGLPRGSTYAMAARVVNDVDAIPATQGDDAAAQQ